MTKTFEATIVLTATVTVNLDEARAYLAERDPNTLAQLESTDDIEGIVEVYVAYAEGDTLEPDFDREIYAHPCSHVGTEGEEA